MALIEKTTRRVEIDEHNGNHIHVRDSTHLVDDQTGEIVHDTVSSHRFVIMVNNDALAASENLIPLADIFWTDEVRANEIALVKAREVLANLPNQ